MKLFRMLVILSHRYLGIALSLLVMVWFVSGIVMMYAGGMPRISPQQRLERQRAIDLAQVRLTPSEASERAGGQGGRVVLTSLMDRPVYRIAGGQPATVFADTGELLTDISLEQARMVASRFAQMPVGDVHHVATLTAVDQWTLGQGRQMPLHKFAVDDGAGTELYVSPATADITMLTTGRSRMLAWAGTIPHWLYFTALRTNQPLWYRIVVWTSAAACVVTLLGLVLGVIQYRRTKPFRLAAAIPYGGWMRWHYITGVVFGVFTLTWAFSGLMSMEPFEWTRAQGLGVSREVFTGGPVDLARFGAIDPAAWERVLGGRVVKEVEFLRIQDRHYYAVRHAAADMREPGRRERLHQPYAVAGRGEPDRLLVAADGLEVRQDPFSVDSLMVRLRDALPDVPIADYQLLTECDSYYYSRDRQAPLPVLRVRFADPAETWFYIDPATSQMLAAIHRLARVERWLFNGLHSLDFAFWYNRRPLWVIGMIALSLGGLASSGIGFYVGMKRVRRGARRATKAVKASPDTRVAASNSVR
jgi:hypothetical protein